MAVSQSGRTPKSLGKHLRERRRAAGMTQEAVAHSARASVATVSRIERGIHVPHVDTLEALACAVGTTAAELLAPEAAA